MVITKTHGAGTPLSTTRATSAVCVKKNAEELEVIWRLGTVNVGSLVGRSAEVVEMLTRRRVDIAGVQEVRYRNSGTRMIKGKSSKYKLFWQGSVTGDGGVGLLVSEEFCKHVVEVRRVSDRIIAIDIVIEAEIVSIVSVYAPQSGRSAEEKDRFYEDLDREVQGRRSKTIVLGDLNGHVGKNQDGFEGVHGGHGFGKRNPEGDRILSFADSMNMIVVNTWFQKKEEHFITYKSGQDRSTVDYILAPKDWHRRMKNVRVIPGECCITQHRLLLVELRAGCKTKSKSKAKGQRKIRLWRLKNEKEREAYITKVQSKLSHASETTVGWEEIGKAMKEAAIEVCGTSKGGRHRATWWWDDEVGKVLQSKKEAYKQWQKDGKFIRKLKWWQNV